MLRLIICLLLSVSYVLATPTIAVLNINSSFSDEKMVVLREKINHEVKDNGTFQLIERSEIDKVFQEQALHQSGVISDETAIEAGNVLGVKYLLLSHLETVKSDLTLSMKIVSVKTGEIKSSVQWAESKNVRTLTKYGITHAVKVLLKKAKLEDEIQVYRSIRKKAVVKTITAFTCLGIGAGTGVLAAANRVAMDNYQTQYDNASAGFDDLEKDYYRSRAWARASGVTAGITLPVSVIFFLLR